VSDAYDSPEWHALVAGVRADPGSDTPRLVAADWLEDHGEGDRAEFVRVGVEASRFATFDPAHRKEFNEAADRWLARRATRLERGESDSLKRARALEEGGKAYKRRHDFLRRREQELWAGFGSPYERSRLFGLPANWLAFLPAETDGVSAGYAPSDGDAVVRRGFLDAVTCPAADWLAHGDAIYAREPVPRVVLTGRLDTGVSLTAGPPDTRRPIYVVWIGHRSRSSFALDEFLVDADRWDLPGAVIRRAVFDLFWPGVEIEEPPEPDWRRAWVTESAEDAAARTEEFLAAAREAGRRAAMARERAVLDAVLGPAP